LPYEPYDTGWTKAIYGLVCLWWLLLNNGLLPRFTLYTVYNNLFIPFTTIIIKLCELIGNMMTSFAAGIAQCESRLFNSFNYVDPIYNGIQYMEKKFHSIIPNYIPTPSFRYYPSNTRRHRTSSGRHLCSYYAHKRRAKQQQIIISGSTYYKSKNDNSHYKYPSTSKNPSSIPDHIEDCFLQE
jgi:hypothetical protein